MPKKKKMKSPKTRGKSDIFKSGYEFVGLVKKINKKMIVIPDNKKENIGAIYLEDCPEKYDNHKAIIRLKSKKNGQIKEIIGPAGKYQTEIKALLIGHNLPENKYDKYSSEIKELSSNWSDRIQKEITTRKDYRQIPTFTIDPASAQDFDDALSVKKLEGDIYEIGVHIADVSFYIKPDSDIYKQIIKQNFSIYLPSKTIHLLPKIFSEQICSLKPNEDRLCLSIIFKIDTAGQIISADLEKTVIKSKKKFSYQEAENIIDTKRGPHFKELKILNSLANKIRQKNIKKGMLPLEEAKKDFTFNNQGKIIAINSKKRLKTEKMIEDFMLLANRQVAEIINKNNKKNHLYRIHDNPPIDKINQLAQILKNFGLNFPAKKMETSSLVLGDFLKNIDNHPQKEIIHKLVIRSLAKAEYSSKNIGHYGLALKDYCHFTSPIRRWPDLIIHYLLKDIINKNQTTKIYTLGTKSRGNNTNLLRLSLRPAEPCGIIPILAPRFGNENVKKHFHFTHSTSLIKIGLNEENISRANEREIEIAEIERRALKLKLIEYLSDKIGFKSQGIIVAITSFGFFVEEEETGAEGLVRISNLKGYYHFDEKNLQLTSKGNRKYSLGDKIKIRLAKVNTINGWIDFELVD